MSCNWTRWFAIPGLILILLSFSIATVESQTQTAPVSPGPTLPKGVERVTSVEGITEYRLPNGLKVLLFPDPTKDTITVNITYLVGSMEENYGETGMAHLLEHVLFLGSKNHPVPRQEFTERGARWNGSTWLDRTNYYETLPATEDNLRWALDLESDRMVNCFVDKKDLDREMTVVRNEYESGENNPTRVLMQRMISTAFLWHNYGHSTIGAKSDIENVPIERLQAFYRMYYQPDNAVLLIAGKFDESKALELVQKYFGVIPKPTRVLPKFYTIEPTQDGERSVTLRRVGDIQLVSVLYHVPAGSHPDFAALDIASFILGDTPSGRLYKALVETKKATSIYSFNFQNQEPAVALFGAEVPKDASIDAAREALIQTLDDFSKKPPTQEEVDRARTAILKDIDLAMNSSDRVGLELSEWIAMGDWRLFFLHRDRIRKVVPDEVQKVAAAYLEPSNMTVGEFIPTAKPERAEIPATPNVAEMVKDYKGDAAVAAGEAFDPSPSNIESRVKRITTPEGLKMALLAKKTRGNKVVARINIRFGNEKSLMNRSTAGSLAGDMLMRGTTKHTRQQIQDELDRLKARAVVVGSVTQAGASIETVRENLPAVLKLVVEMLREPSFPASEFELLKQEQITGIEQQRSEPDAMAEIEYARHMNPYPKGDVRYEMTIDESLAELKETKLEDVIQFYRDFYGATNTEISVVGDFDDAEVSQLMTDLFKDWKSPQVYERIPGVYHDVSPIDKKLETPDKANAFFVAGINLSLRDDDPAYPALVMGNYMLGGASNSRLRVRIRTNEGISYSVGSQLSASPLDKDGSFEAFAIYAPENLARLESAFQEEMNLALKSGFTPEELKLASTGYLQARQVARAQDNELAGKLLAYLFLDRTLNWDAEFEQKIKSLTPEQIVEAMRTFIDPAKLTIVKAGDFAKGSK